MSRTAGWVSAATGGRLVSGTPADAASGNVSVDTRLLAPGDVFVALPGFQVDGGRFVRAALEAGAGGVVAAPEHLASPPVLSARRAGSDPAHGVVPARRAGSDPARRAFAVAVDDPHAALRALAIAWRGELDLTHAVGVTGAAGKTTTKDMIAALLAPHVEVHATRHGFNTHQGVAATVAGAPASTGALVVELGQRRLGDVAAMAEVLRPTAAVLTNMGPEHLDTMGSVEAVAAGKAQLLAALPPGAPCVVPAGEPLLAPHLRDDLRTVTHGEGGDVRLARFDGAVATIALPDRLVDVRTPLPQPHNVENLVAAVALLHAFGIDPPPALGPLPTPLRWELGRTAGPVELVLDCAKTSPLSLRRALEAFCAEPAAGRRIAVLGELPDLGDAAAAHHAAAGALAARLGLDLLVTVGPHARAFLDGWEGPHHATASTREARALLERIGRPGDRALVKGRRTDALEDIAA